MERYCDHTSVGVIIENDAQEIVLLDRARFPFGLAAPSGHIDSHGTAQEAAVTEVYEEVGLELPISALRKVIDNRRVDNQCRREQGSHHNWTVYTATSGGSLRPSDAETKGATWVTRSDLQSLAEAGSLEPIWRDFLTELGYISSLDSTA